MKLLSPLGRRGASPFLLPELRRSGRVRAFPEEGPAGRGAGSVRAGFSCSRERRGGEETEGLGGVRRVNCPRELEPASSGDSWKALGPHLLATVSTVYYGLFSELRIYSVIQIFN